MKDGFCSASRYFISNFSDSRKQDVLELILGNIQKDNNCTES